MTADEARELLRLFRVELASSRPAELPAKPVIVFFRKMLLAQERRQNLLSAGR